MKESMNEPAPAETKLQATAVAQTTTSEAKTRAQAPVDSRTETEPFSVSCIKNWKMAMELWEQPLLVEWRLAMLHQGFQLETANQEATAQRIIFYLETADGYLSNSNFTGMRDTCLRDDSYDSEAGLAGVSEASRRQRIAVKAWKALCTNFFKNTQTNPYIDIPSWARTIVLPGVLEKVIWFFRAEEDSMRIITVRNASQKGAGVYHEITRKFIHDLVIFVWNFRCFGRYGEKEDECIRKRLDEVKGGTIDIMDHFGWLDGLLKDAYKPDLACRKQLELIAMREQRWVSNENAWRCPTSIEEAAWLGSKAAQIILLLRNNHAMKERHDRLIEVKRQKDEAERRWKDLQECETEVIRINTPKA